ncbi:MAG: ABC transporter permease [Sphingomonadaceae bacterium]
MNPLLLAWRNANGNPFRSWVIAICSALMAGFAVSASIVVGGAQNSLQLALQRLGADIIVVPEGTEESMENAFLMGVPAKAWMPRSVVEGVATIPEVEAVSPQLFLSSLRGATCCSVPEMFLVAYEPETDFTLRPWLEEHLDGGLGLGEAIGGAFVYVPANPGQIYVYGYGIDLRGNLEQTGTGIDQTMFFTFDTALEIARQSPFLAAERMEIPPDSVSAVMVKLRPGADPSRVSSRIRASFQGVAPVESTSLFRAQREQLPGLLRGVVVLLGIAWLLSVALVGMVYSLAVNERRQQIGVLRAIGFGRGFVTQSLLAEGLILASAGAAGGIAVSAYTVYLFHDLIVGTMGIPFLFPSTIGLFLLATAALVLTLASVALGALVPTLKIGRLEPAVAMRR